jgi:penicillin-binding protein 2
MENPKIAIAVMIENGGFGSAIAGPIASLLIEKYLRQKITRVDLEKSTCNKFTKPLC